MKTFDLKIKLRNSFLPSYKVIILINEKKNLKKKSTYLLTIKDIK